MFVEACGGKSENAPFERVVKNNAALLQLSRNASEMKEKAKPRQEITGEACGKIRWNTKSNYSKCDIKQTGGNH